MTSKSSNKKPYLEVEDDGPDEAQGEFRVPVDDVLATNVDLRCERKGISAGIRAREQENLRLNGFIK